MSTDVSTTNKKPDLISLVSSDNFKKQAGMVLAKHLTPDRFVRVAITSMRRVPKLQQCTAESLLSCLITCAQYGLEPDGRRAHLIPYKDECTLIIDYKGLAELVLRSGLVSYIHADVVYEGDSFEYNMGKIVSHVPWFLRRDAQKPADPGKEYAVYAVVVNKDGTSKSEVLSVSEVKAIQSRSKAGNVGPWKTDWNEMAKKTAFRRLSKWLVLSPEFRDAADADDDDMIETTAVRKEKESLASLVENVGVPEHENDEDAPVSSLRECQEYLDALAMDKNSGVRYVGAADGIYTFELRNKSTLKIGDRAKGEGSVDTLDKDAFTQVKNTVEHAAK